MEKRIYTIDELRADSQGEDLIITGRAIKYGQRSGPNVPKAGCREIISQGCFRDSLKSGEPVILDCNHNEFALPLGTTQNRSLVLNDQSDGLYFRARLNPAVQAHRDVHALVKDGTLSQCSFAFSEPSDSWSDEYDEESHERCYLRTIRSARLLGISLVNRPAYDEGTYAEARSRLNAWLESGRRPLSDAELRKAVEDIGVQMRIGDAEYGWMEVRDANGRVTGFEPISHELMLAIATARSRMFEAELAREVAKDAQTELVERFEDRSQARLDPQNPNWGPRLA